VALAEALVAVAQPVADPPTRAPADDPEPSPLRRPLAERQFSAGLPGRRCDGDTARADPPGRFDLPSPPRRGDGYGRQLHPRPRICWLHLGVRVPGTPRRLPAGEY